jgi:hypothetical protein
MEGWHWAIILKPLGLLLLFFFVHSIAMLIHKFLPDGKLKRFLFISWKV